MKSSNAIPLESIRIARPCRADWEAMSGDERARFCGTCHKNVYDLSGMTRAEADALIRENEGEVCLRLHRRADGTVLTSDCPVGVSQARRPFWWLGAAFAALIVSGFAVNGQAASGGGPPSVPECSGILTRWFSNFSALGYFARPRTTVMMGAAAPLPPTPVPKTTPRTQTKKSVPPKPGRGSQHVHRR